MYTSSLKSIAQKIIQERGARVEFLALKDHEGNDVHMFALFKETEFKKFMDEVGKGIINPEDHGVVIVKGEGKVPPKEVLDAMKILFGDSWIGDKDNILGLSNDTKDSEE